MTGGRALLCVMSVCAVVWFLLNVREYQHHKALYLSREMEKFDRAKTYMESAVCSDPNVKSKLEGFNLCHEAKEILVQDPDSLAQLAAIHAIGPCSGGQCDYVFREIVGNVKYLIIACLILCFAVIKYSASEWKSRMNKFGGNLPTFAQVGPQWTDVTPGYALTGSSYARRRGPAAMITGIDETQ
jgi:hypothetical protein